MMSELPDCLFEEQEHARLYARFRPQIPASALSAIIQYVQRKSGRRPGLAVDVGCGSGQATRALGSHCHRVLGLDVSRAQLAEARRLGHAENVSFMEGRAEEVPLPDSSVSLLSACTAVHWFPLDAFMREARRVLQPGGSLALLCPSQDSALECGAATPRLTCLYGELMDELKPYESHCLNHIRQDFDAIFDAIPFHDKERDDRIEGVDSMRVPDILGLFSTFSSYQTMKKVDPERARAFDETAAQRIHEALGEAPKDTVLQLRSRYFLLLATKSPAA